MNKSSTKATYSNIASISHNEVPSLKSSRYNYTYPLSVPIVNNGIISFKIAVIADLDTNSRIGTTDEWKSYLKTGIITYNTRKKSIDIIWNNDDIQELVSNYGHKGRGMELSELVIFNGRLLSFDDRTGIVYEIVNKLMIPWVILTDGEGKSAKGFKSEWATVKDEILYVGSIGKEWTSSTGEYVNDDPMFIKQITIDGEIKSCNWAYRYKVLRKAVGIDFPGYLMHESGSWSEAHKKWFFLPRRCSTESYSEKKDEKMGCNLLISANEEFSVVHTTRIGELDPVLGYSSFKFLPNTNDTIIVALISEEVNGKTASYMTVFETNGNIIYPLKKISSTLKFEGIEFV